MVGVDRSLITTLGRGLGNGLGGILGNGLGFGLGVEFIKIILSYQYSNNNVA